MLTLTFTVLAGVGAGLLAAGALLAWLCIELRSRRSRVPVSLHRAELLAQRRRFRQRLRSVRDDAARARAAEQDARRDARLAAEHDQTQERLLAGARAEVERLRARIAELEHTDSSRAPELLRLRAREQALRDELRAAQERIAGFERDQGLLRIERDELEARTQRLRALEAPPAAAGASGRLPVPAQLRTEIADRDARIHELECELRQRQSQVDKLETDLRTWKFRIAPLALHMKMRRARASGESADAQTLRTSDDLRRIRGIGRTLEKKLRAAGVSEYAHIAAMSPAELANLAVRVGVAASRPGRDRWAEQAQELCASRAVAVATTGEDSRPQAGMA